MNLWALTSTLVEEETPASRVLRHAEDERRPQAAQSFQVLEEARLLRARERQRVAQLGDVVGEAGEGVWARRRWIAERW